MNDRIKQFIEENKNLIEEDKWEDLYKEANDSLLDVQIGELSSIFLNAGINPLFYLEKVPTDFLYRSEIKQISIPSNIKSIGMYSFYKVSDLKSINIPAITDLGRSSFAFSRLEEVIFSPESTLKRIPLNAFGECKYLTNVQLPQNLGIIGRGAFRGCSSLPEITLPKSLVSIEATAFFDCDNLTDVYYKGTFEEWKDMIVGASAFPNKTEIHCLDKNVKVRIRAGGVIEYDE